jgi:fatty-acyl-CoA synthase
VAREQVSFTVIVGDPFCIPILEELEAARDANQAYDLSSLKTIMSSGVAWSSESKSRLLAFGDFQLIDAMGATEGFMGMQIHNRSSPPGQAGQFIKMAETRVFDDNDQEIEPGSGVSGHIAAGGDSVPIGYYKDAEKSAKTFRTIGGKRYAFIGDQGTIEADGSLTVHGRGSGCINTAGEKVFPEEVESLLKSHDAINDCIVIGLPDPKYGQTVAAVIATRLSAEALESLVRDLCEEKLAGYKRPRTLAIQEKIRRAPNGKPDLPWAKSVLEST